MAKTLPFTAHLLDHLIDEYFEGDEAALAHRTGYSKHHIQSWRSGKRKPQRASLRWLLSATIAPEFKVVAEFAVVRFNSLSDVGKELKRVLNGHENKAGVYAFYDSMCSVIYIGKASQSLLSEMNQQLRGELGIAFPHAVRPRPEARWEVVSRVSAYEIPSVDHLDYPKHVESLILRLSKPRGNKVLGSLTKSRPPKVKG